MSKITHIFTMSTHQTAGPYSPLEFHVPRKHVRVDTASTSLTSSTGPPPYRRSFRPHKEQPTVSPWAPKHRKHIPWVAVTSLIVALGCIGACVAILASSDGQPIESWPTTGAPVQPSVMLSVAAAVANMSIRFMFCEGLNISWWRKALRGSTVGELHRTWAFGSNLWEVFGAGRNFNMIALASLLVSIVAVDGPLLQKASKVTSQQWTETSMVTVGLGSNTSLLEHPTGYYTGRAPVVSSLSSEFLTTIQQFNNRGAITLTSTGCSGSCNATIIGPGFDIRCSKTLLPLDLEYIPGYTTPVLGFSFNFTGMFDADVINLNTTLRTSEDPYNLTYHSCSLHLATVNYPVILSNNTVTLLEKATPETNETISLDYLGYEGSGMGTSPSSLGGLALIADRKYSSTAELYMNGSPFQLFSTGSSAVEYLDPIADQNNATWLDPTNDMLSAVREIMFRYAVQISNSSAVQSVSADTTYQRTVYQSDYHFLGYAIIFMGLAIIVTCVNVLGWWDLGRSFNLGPFEMAKAFNAPYLADTDFITTNEKAFKNISKRKIQYGGLSAKSLRVLPRNNSNNESKEELVGTAVDENSHSSPGSAMSSPFERSEYKGVAEMEESGRTRTGMGFPADLT